MWWYLSENKQGSNKERADVLHKKLFSFEEMYALSIYKVRQNYFPFEQLSALVYTARWQAH